MILSAEVVELIERELMSGNSIEVKKERDNIVVVRLDRKVQIKSPITALRSNGSVNTAKQG